MHTQPAGGLEAVTVAAKPAGFERASDVSALEVCKRSARVQTPDIPLAGSNLVARAAALRRTGCRYFYEAGPTSVGSIFELALRPCIKILLNQVI